MQHTPEQLEAELMVEARTLIAELVAWERQAGAPKLSEMEEQVLAVRQQLGTRLLKTLIEDQEARQPAESPKCPTCGAEMRYKGQKGTDIETRLGGIKVERGYYYCAHCDSGLFPPG
jgi:tRNA(Ile2) C34 agmatinyltransferase TiaS